MRMIDLTYKIRIYPNKKQKEIIERYFDKVKLIYNFLLYSKIKTYIKTGIVLDESSDLRFLSILKDSSYINNSFDTRLFLPLIFELNKTFKYYVNNKKGFPKYKNSFSYLNLIYNNSFKLYDNKVFISNIGYIKAKNIRKSFSIIVKIILSKDKLEHYYLKLVCRRELRIHNNLTGTAVGIDFGIKYFLVTSSGIKVKNERFLDQEIKKINQLQKELSGKVVGSNNWSNTKLKLSKIYRRIYNRRKDFLHKLSTIIVKRYDVICIERLNIRELLQNGKKSNNKARMILDLAWYQFTRMLEYKAELYGKEVIKVSRWYPSSQICSNCGYRNVALKELSVRTWVCPNCKSEHDRDINAARNIMIKALCSREHKPSGRGR